MGVNENINFSNSHLTLNTFKDIFQKIEPNIVIESFEEAQGSGRGDNYTATLYRVHLSGYSFTTENHYENRIKWDKSVICKRLPNNAARREAYKSVQLFRNEVGFYTRIIPELINFQKSKTSEVFKAIPKSYLARNDLLIMEDLLIRGFKMSDRKCGLQVDQIRLVLKEIAVMHSLSLAYKVQHPKLFDNLKKLITEGIFCLTNENWYKNYYQQLSKNAVNMVANVLPSDSLYTKKMIEFCESPKFFSKMIELITKESKLSVICHGDCWTNNFLFLYDKDCKVLETSLVDFQLIRYGSPALDVSSLIYCCTTKAIRDEHLNSFIRLYTNELYKSLKVLGSISEYFETEDECFKLFQDELKIYGKFALGIALDILPISTCSAEDAPDLCSEFVSELSNNEEPTSAPTLNLPPNDLCKQKLTEVVIDLVDNGIL